MHVDFQRNRQCFVRVVLSWYCANSARGNGVPDMKQNNLASPSAPLYLRQWREHRGFSQERVAQLMSDFLGREIARDRVSRLENGVNWPREDIMAAFAYALGVEVTMLFAAPTADTARRQKLALLERLASDSDLDAFVALLNNRKTP